MRSLPERGTFRVKVRVFIDLLLERFGERPDLVE